MKSLQFTLSSKVLLCSIVLFCQCFLLVAQKAETNKVIPPSPDVAALGKYGSVPVGMHTGVPNISIPLYTIKTKKLQVPITLNYHAAGFRVTDIAPWTGLGWTIDAGGVISRSAVGLGDDAGGAYFDNPQIQNYSELTAAGDWEYMLMCANNLSDNESDFYFYNFGGRSGKFVLDKNKLPFLIPQEQLAIQYNYAGFFEIKDENGVVYKFASRETITAGTYTQFGESAQSYTGGYYLTKITSADGTDVIDFAYDGDGTYTENSTGYSETVGDKCLSGSGAPITGQRDWGYSFSFRRITPIRLTTITFTNGKVEFVKVPDRTDLPGVGSRLTEVKIFLKNSAGVDVLKKSIKFQTGYFPNFGPLKLNGITEMDTSTPSKAIKKHEFFYDETNIPYRNLLAQDWWGFYNGQTTNQTLVAQETLKENGLVYQVGGANRNPNAATMQGAILKKIKYPTGGYTEFDYEPHYYSGLVETEIPVPSYAGVLGNTTDLQQHTVTFTPLSNGFAKVTTFCSNVNDGTPFFSTVTLTGNGQTLVDHQYTPYNTPPPFAPEFAKDYWVELLANVPYTLTTKSKGTSTSTLNGGASFSSATVYYKNSVPGTQMAGGLRVKEIRDFASATATPVTKLYKYGLVEGGVENGKGTIITPQNRLSSFKERRQEFFWTQPPQNLCFVSCSSTRLHIYGNSVHDLTTFSGAPVVYSQVTVYEKSASAPNGKSVFQFNVIEDEFYPAPSAYKNGLYQVSNSWKGGDMIYSAEFKGNTADKIKETTSTYPVVKVQDIIGTHIAWLVDNVGECGPVIGSINGDVFFYRFDYPIRSGIKKIKTTTESVRSSADQTKINTSTVTYNYDNLATNRQQLSNKVTVDSEGNTILNKYWYTQDYTTATENALVLKNIIAPVIKEETHRNGQIVSGTVNKLNLDGEPIELHQYESSSPQTPPAHSASTLVPPGYVKKADMAYDATSKNIVSVQPVDDIKTIYIWGYNQALPIAKVVNAPSQGTVFHTSFEEDLTLTSTDAKTGAKSHTGVYSMVAPKIIGDYIITYYEKLTGTNSWLLRQISRNIATTNEPNIPLGVSTSLIDEVRFYPVGAQMTTHTYDPIYGMTSATDPNNRTQYFEYDSFGNLRFVRDDKMDIVKKYEYHYEER